MAKKPNYAVFITKEARELLKDEEISDHLKDGKYFNCVTIEPNNALFNFKLKHESKLGEIIAEFSIPHHFVLYVTSAEDKRSPGL